MKVFLETLTVMVVAAVAVMAVGGIVVAMAKEEPPEAPQRLRVVKPTLTGEYLAPGKLRIRTLVP